MATTMKETSEISDDESFLLISDLHRAVAENDLEVVQTLIVEGHNPATPDDDGLEPLHWACYFGYEEIVRYLASLPNYKDFIDNKSDLHDGCTPLFIACVRNHTGCINALADKADCAAVNHKRQPMVVLLSWNAEKPLIKTLHDHGADLNATDGFQFHALHAAARGGNERVLKYILGQVADPDVKDNKGETPLAYAAKEGKDKCVEMLLNFKADRNTSNLLGQRPLHHAALNNEANAVELLLSDKISAPADVNLNDNEGTKPLHAACAAGAYEAAKILLEHGADKDALDRECRTPLWYACNGGHFRCVELLMECKADAKIFCRAGFQPIQRATMQGSASILKHMVKHCVEVPERANEMVTLEMAEKSGDEEIMEIVKQHVSSAQPEADGDTRTTLPSVEQLADCIPKHGIPRSTVSRSLDSKQEKIQKTNASKMNVEKELHNLKDLFELENVELYYDHAQAGLKSFADLWHDIDNDDCDIFTKIPHHDSSGYKRLTSQFQGVPDYISEHEKTLINAFCQVKETSIELVHFYNKCRYTNFIHVGKLRFRKVAIFVRYSTGHYTLLLRKGKRFKAQPRTMLEKYVHSFQHQRHILEQSQSLISLMTEPCEIIADELLGLDVLNRREHEIITEEQDIREQVRSLLDVMIYKNKEEYNTWKDVMRKQNMHEAADLLEFVEPWSVRMNGNTDLNNMITRQGSSGSQSDYPHKQHILDNLTVISQQTDLDLLLDVMAASRLLEYEFVQDFRQMSGGHIKKSADIWGKFANEPLQTFVVLLGKLRPNFPELVDMLEDRPRKIPEPSHWKCLRRYTEYLKNSLDTRDVLNCLYRDRVISFQEKNLIAQRGVDHEKVEELMQVLHRKPSAKFKIFKDVLRETNQNHIALRLEGHTRVCEDSHL